MNTITATPNQSLQGDILTQEEFQQELADKLEKSTLGTTDNGDKVTNIISKFVQSYEQNKDQKALDVWLIDEFKQYPDIWQNEQEITDTAHEVIDTVKSRNADYISLQEHLETGKSQESWLANHLEQGAKAAGVVNVGDYASQIEQAIETANQGMRDTIFTRSGEISQAANLDGFLAEQHHVDTFNIEARAQGSKVTAKVLTPEAGQTYGKNSMDIGIYDENGKLVKRYQAKYGKDADATQTLLDKGDYRGQRKLVPSEQVDEVNGATDRIEHDGIKSKPLSKAEAKALQEKAQLQHEAKEYQWNEVNRTQIAKNIGKQALISAGMTAAFHGARIVGRRLWNRLQGKSNVPVSEDLKEFFESSLKSGSHVGAQVAVSGAVVVAVKNGWMGTLAKNTKSSHIVVAVHTALENAKILYKVAKGELSKKEGLDQMGKLNVSLAGGLWGAAEGAAFGAAIGTAFGPVGTVVGGIVGGVVGGMAGSKIGEMVYSAGKTVVKTAVSVVRNAVKEVASGITSVARGVSNFVSSAFSWW